MRNTSAPSLRSFSTCALLTSARVHRAMSGVQPSLAVWKFTLHTHRHTQGQRSDSIHKEGGRLYEGRDLVATCVALAACQDCSLPLSLRLCMDQKG